MSLVPPYQSMIKPRVMSATVLMGMLATLWPACDGLAAHVRPSDLSVALNLYLAAPVLAVQTVPVPGPPDLSQPRSQAQEHGQTERIRREIQQLEAQANSPGATRAPASSATPTASKRIKPQSRKKLKAQPSAAATQPSPTVPVDAWPDGKSETPAGASWLLGLIYLHGAGTVRDSALAHHWFEQAWALGEPWAAAGMAWCAMDGCGASPDVSAAARWLERLHPVHPDRALYLEWLLRARSAPMSTPTSPPTSPALLARAAAAGDVQALIESGMQDVTQGNLGHALLHFQTASGRSDVARDNARWVAERLRSESHAGTATTADELLIQAQRAHRGEGQIANYSEALRLYQLAQARGSLAARRMLGLIYSRPGPDGQLDVQWMRQLAFVDPTSNSPVPGQVPPAHGLHREPSPLADLLPPLWRARITAVGP